MSNRLKQITKYHYHAIAVSVIATLAIAWVDSSLGRVLIMTAVLSAWVISSLRVGDHVAVNTEEKKPKEYGSGVADSLAVFSGELNDFIGDYTHAMDDELEQIRSLVADAIVTLGDSFQNMARSSFS